MEPTIVLKTEGLTKQYGKFTAVNDLSLEVHEGEVFGFLGPNGAGKTTSISMICGLLKPTQGKVFIKGEQIDSGSEEVRARVGVCPQEIVVWPRLTCLEQLVFIGQMYNLPTAKAKERGKDLLNDLGLFEKRNSQARTLSGGMKRRLNVAMALVHDPEIVVFDEPEAGLDPQSRIKVRDYIRSLARKKTIILTTHNMDEADRVVDRLAIIDHGKLLVLESPQKLKQSVGEGDILELSLLDERPDEEAIQKALEPLVSESNIDADNGLLVIRSLNAVAALPSILEALEKTETALGEVRIRENTLEDVFIQLTGRSLRDSSAPKAEESE